MMNLIYYITSLSLYATTLLPIGVRTGTGAESTALLTPFFPSTNWSASTGRNISIAI